jgi:hypothetical protein
VLSAPWGRGLGLLAASKLEPRNSWPPRALRPRRKICMLAWLALCSHAACKQVSKDSGRAFAAGLPWQLLELLVWLPAWRGRQVSQ